MSQQLEAVVEVQVVNRLGLACNPEHIAPTPTASSVGDGTQETGPMLPLRAEPGQALWEKVQTPGTRILAPIPGLAQR